MNAITPDFNQTEHLWKELKHTVGGKNALIREKWSSLVQTSREVEHLIRSKTCRYLLKRVFDKILVWEPRRCYPGHFHSKCYTENTLMWVFCWTKLGIIVSDARENCRPLPKHDELHVICVHSVFWGAISHISYCTISARNHPSLPLALEPWKRVKCAATTQEIWRKCYAVYMFMVSQRKFKLKKCLYMGLEGTEALSVIGRDAGYTLDMSPVYRRANTTRQVTTHTYSQSRITS